MTYQAKIRLCEPNINANQFLILELNATDPESALQAIKQQWKKIKQQLPQVTAPRLLQVEEVPTSCPRCGATELSFCHHPKEGLKKITNTT